MKGKRENGGSGGRMSKSPSLSLIDNGGASRDPLQEGHTLRELEKFSLVASKMVGGEAIVSDGDNFCPVCDFLCIAAKNFGHIFPPYLLKCL